MEFIKVLLNLIYSIGYFGDYIIFIFGIIVLLYSNPIIVCISFIIFFFLGKYLVDIIRNIIKQKRPERRIKFLTDESPTTKYGMPSGHNESTGFSTIFIYLATKKYLWLMLIISAIVAYQRYKFRNHTIPQIICGYGIGLLLGYLSFILTRWIVKF